ncbi:MAG: aldehyde dehydrogenase family protein [Planctomycetaceae bacterium]|nr:aldehyde dehydrogenase family protein [Planctomycetaceae bacterium]
MDATAYVADLVDKARQAQSVFAGYSQRDVDKAVRAIGKAVFDNAETISRLAVEETGMGRYEDKLAKNKGKAKAIWAGLKGKASRGVLRRLEEEGIVEVAKPMGVIGAVTPVTNPTSTPLHNAMIALKGGNAIIIAPHPHAKACGKATVAVMNEALARIDAPEHLIQIVDEPTVEISTLIMRMTDVCISTGGPGMVKAAYGSGKPAFGVGPGNVQCLVDADATLPEAVAKCVRGRIYDNGILCTCEQAVLVSLTALAQVMDEFSKNGAYVVTEPADVAKLRRAAFPDGVVNKKLVGATPQTIADAAGLAIPKDARLIVAMVDKYGPDEPLAREKLFPLLALYTYATREQAIDIAEANLTMEGRGHSVVIHSYTAKNIEYAAERLPVSRFSINQTGSNSLGGSFANGLNPTLTLGCGSWGNNSLSENLWYTHLVNISRIAYEKKHVVVPSDEEVWADD